MGVGAAVMAHISRTEMVNQLLSDVDGDVEVVYDTLPPSKDPLQRWSTARKAWEAAASAGEEWSVVVQDDAVLCEDFLAGLSAAVSHVRRPAVVSAYMGVGRPIDRQVKRVLAVADRSGHSWAEMALCYWGVAVALPTEMVPGLVKTDYGAKRNYDTRLARYCHDLMGLSTLYTIPSLADHRDGPSLVGHDVPGRHAARFTGKSALDVDWSLLPPKWQDEPGGDAE